MLTITEIRFILDYESESELIRTTWNDADCIFEPQTYARVSEYLILSSLLDEDVV